MDDYTGVPMKQLQKRIHLALAPVSEGGGGKSKQFICKRSGLDHRELSRILKNEKNNILALHKSDLILMAIDDNLGILELKGKADILPLGSHKINARLMAEDLLGKQEGEELDAETVEQKMQELLINKKAVLMRLSAEDEIEKLAIAA